MDCTFPFLRLRDVNAPYLARMEQATLNVMRSGYYIGGKPLEKFERMLARSAQTPYAIGVTNGLDALRLSLRAFIELGQLKSGDAVMVPANTYIATVLAITCNGLRPVFVEPDLISLNMDTSRLEEFYTPDVKAIMPVHLYGRTVWDTRLVDFVKAHDLVVVEDNAQAIGARSGYPGLFGTNVTGGLGHAGAFSFYPTKNIGALGDAGAVVTHDPEVAQLVKALRNYGSLEQYNNMVAGFNCRLDTVKAAQLSVKLPYLQRENKLRRLRALIYNREITNPLVIKPEMPENPGTHVWHQYVVRVDNRDRFREYLLENGVQTAVHYAVPPTQQPCYREFAGLKLPVTTEIARTVVSLPITRTTTTEDACRIAEIINGFTGK